MKIKIGDYDVLESGTVVSLSDKYIDFIIDANSEFIFRMNFPIDKEKNGADLKIDSFGENGVQVSFINITKIGGHTSSEPIPVGNYSNRKLYLTLSIFNTDNDAGKLIHYTWLLGEVTDGK